MIWFDLLLFLHIISVIALIGGSAALGLAVDAARQQEDVRTTAALSRVAVRIQTLMVQPGSVATIVTGVVLALVAGIPIVGFLQGASQNWLLVANILLIANIVIVATVMTPGGKAIGAAMGEAMGKGQITPALRAALDNPRMKLGHQVTLAFSLIIALLMVFKPF
jgi:uncharacterized membrane protein